MLFVHNTICAVDTWIMSVAALAPAAGQCQICPDVFFLHARYSYLWYRVHHDGSGKSYYMRYSY
jgi:hypothetical protein